MGYLALGQTHNAFSGSEAQRLKLANKLNKIGKKKGNVDGDIIFAIVKKIYRDVLIYDII